MHLPLHFLSLLIPTFQQTWNDRFILVCEYGSVGTQHPFVVAIEYDLVQLCGTHTHTGLVLPVHDYLRALLLIHHCLILPTTELPIPSGRECFLDVFGPVDLC